MTQDEVIRMAIQCQLVNTSNRDGIYMDALQAFAKLVAAKEREACIHVCKEIYSAWACESDDDVDYPNPNDCIRAIRARGEA
jgi:hypothetical protein